MLDDELLARVRDVEPVEAQVAGGAAQFAHRLRAHTEHVDVDEPVHIPQSLPVGLTFVQGRTEGVPDTGTDQPDEIRPPRPAEALEPGDVHADHPGGIRAPGPVPALDVTRVLKTSATAAS